MYDELVKRLRCQRFGNCPNCPMWYTEEVEPNLWRERCAAIDAANAIEELNSQLDDFKRLCLPLKENRLYKYSDGSFVEVFLILPSEPPKEE